MEAVLYWLAITVHKTCPGEWLIYLLAVSFGGKLFSLPQRVANSILARGRTLCPCLLLHDGILFGLNLILNSWTSSALSLGQRSLFWQWAMVQVGTHDWMNPKGYLATEWL